MLLNIRNQIVTLTYKQEQICAYRNRKDARARVEILSTLRETKQHPNPCGRGTNGMFSLGERAKLISYTYDWLYGRQRVVQTNLFAC
jgi:hypothetical protein